MQKLRSKKQLILYGCSGLGVNMLTLILGTHLCSALLTGGFIDNVASWTYLNKNLVIAGLWSVLIFFAKALDGIIDLPLATFADKLNTRFGRRKTALALGWIPMVIMYLLFLVPLNNGATLLNTIWFGILLCGFYTCYTLTMLTYYATFSEVCEDEKATFFLSNTKSICDVVYFSLGYALIPLFINLQINIRIVALIFLPLALSMLIPFFLLKENADGSEENVRALTLKESLSVSFKNKTYIYWLFTAAIMSIGVQLFLGGVAEVFSTTGLNMTFVMASSFAPVPLTIMVYNKMVKKYGLAIAYQYILSIFSVGMLIMFVCVMNAKNLSMGMLTGIAIGAAVLVSFAIGAFFSVTYMVPSYLARLTYERTGKGVASMYFAVQGLFEGIAAGIATGLILVTLKDNGVIHVLPLIVVIFCMAAFLMSCFFDDDVRYMGKVKTELKV